MAVFEKETETLKNPSSTVIWFGLSVVVSRLSQSRQKAVIQVAQPFKVVDFQTNLHVPSAPNLVAGGRVFRWLAARFKSRCVVLALFVLFIIKVWDSLAEAQIPANPIVESAAEINAAMPSPNFSVAAYIVEDHALLPTNNWSVMLSKYTGTNVSLDEVVQAATIVQTEYRNHGYPNVSIAIAKEQVKDGVVTLNVFQTAIPQIVVSGVRYYTPTNVGCAPPCLRCAPVLVPRTAATAATATKTAAPPPTRRRLCTQRRNKLSLRA